MNARVLVLLCLPGLAQAQGSAGLGGEAGGFALPSPSVAPAFPEDYGAHPGYRIEWWCVTANLTGLDGTPYRL